MSLPRVLLSLERRRRLLASLVATASLLFGGLACEEVAEGLRRAVVIEYDHALNFRSYRFDPPLKVAWGGGNTHAWEEIQTDDRDNDGVSERGVWALFQICAIHNSGSEAEDFHFDASKLYVHYEGADQFHRALDPRWFGSASTPVGYDNYEPVAEGFRQQVQVGPDAQLISPGFTDTLSIAWRYPILVTTAENGVIDFQSLDLELRYDGRPVLLDDRGNPPIKISTTWDPVWKAEDFPDTCRPPA